MVSTLVPSTTGGVNLSMMVTVVDGYLLEMESAAESPNIPAPIMITLGGKELQVCSAVESCSPDMAKFYNARFSKS